MMPLAACPAARLRFPVLPVPTGPVTWWAHLRSALLPTGPDEVPEPQPTAEVPAETAAPAACDTLRVGDYTVGEANCPELYGHPDIRY
ncbi:hypothetical protein [Hymenobacter yonginensis]|uniref:Uncharacterized protein n=1 Tax=Hymenobacter yonginensis TaxID=748197 RepID=A0ABY7PQC3_9BACT|nr:hypothetical protein [Hymenobacter yonginensis]WBO84285.1 hypothetical protein O9Z63_18175 [Hymenobacter yonginensis]